MPAAIVFPDAAELVATYLREALAAAGFPVRVGRQVPNPRPADFVRLKRIGGARLDAVTDRPRLDVHCWGADDERAHDLTQVTRALLLAIPGWHGAAAYDAVEVGGPNELPDPETSSPRFAFAVEVSLRGKRLTTAP